MPPKHNKKLSYYKAEQISISFVILLW